MFKAFLSFERRAFLLMIFRLTRYLLGISINRFSVYGRLPTNSYRLQTIDRMFVFKRPDVFFNQPDVF